MTDTLPTALSIDLGWPVKALSPNARVHHMALWRAKKDAKTEAGWATKSVKPLDWSHGGSRLPVHFIATPPIIRDRDDDNLIASAKAHLDGIAAALGINDKLFIAPTIEWKEPRAPGKLTVVIGA